MIVAIENVEFMDGSFRTVYSKDLDPKTASELLKRYRETGHKVRIFKHE